jgi:hypothetical protein
VEGGKYDFTAGAWTLALTVSSGLAQGQSVTWDQLPPDWAWDQFDPAITWDDLSGVGPPETL